MGKISQEEARKVSWKIVEPINKKIKEVNKEIKELLTSYYLKTIPKEVMTFWKKHSEFVYTKSNVYVRGIGITGNYQTEYIDNLPTMGSSTPTLELSKEESAAYLKLSDKQDELNEKYNNTQKEIEVMILALGTHKRVAESLPEAMEFFPESQKQNTQLIVQVAPVREKIKCLVSPEQDKKCIDQL